MKKTLLFILLLLGTSLTAATPIADENSLKILTPSLQERTVTKFKLDNGLQVLVVTDPLLDKSGAALAVGSGSLDEPNSTPGLAHFLEHMLFMGTEKYPDENLYWDFISTHGGTTNAFTDNDRTVYMFSISNDAFIEALDKFAQFFIAPLFNQSGITKEMHAVDQEFRNYISNDDWRVMGLIQALNNKNSPLSRFTVGSLETLSNVTTEELKEWWQTHYSAHEMRLVIYSPLPIDVIEKNVTEDFSAIKNVPVKHPQIEPSLLPAYTNKVIKAESIQDTHALYFSFDLDKSYYYQVKLLQKALSDESQGAFLRFLQDKGFADSIDTISGKAYDRLLFIVKITLTEKGEKNFEEVVQDFFGALKVFEEQGISENYFKDMQESARLTYAYQSPQNVFKSVMKDGSALLDEDLSTYPQNTVLLTDYNPAKMKALLQSMTLKDAYVLLLSPTPLKGESERWFGTNYKIESFSERFEREKADAFLPPITLPETNPYIPKNTSLVECSDISLLPEKVFDADGCTCYFLCDNQFNMPITSAIVRMRPGKNGSLGTKSSVVRDFIIKAAEYKLGSAVYQATQVGFDITLEEKEGAFLIKVAGFSESLGTFIKQATQTLKNLSLTPQEFATIKSSLMQSYQNALAAEPYIQGIAIAKQILSKSSAPLEKKIRTLSKMNLQAFEKSSEKIFSRFALETLIFGNITKEDAAKLGSELQSTLQTSLPEELYEPAFFVETKGPVLLAKSIKQLGNFTALIIEDGCYSLEKDAALALLTRGLSEPFFSELRTRQQTGYIVKNTSPSNLGLLAEIFLAQSTTHDPSELLYRFELFLEQFNLDETRFNALKKSYIEELKSPEKSPLEKAERLDKMAFALKGDFAYYDNRIKAAENLSFTTFQSFYKSFLARSNKARIAVLLKGEQQGERSLSYKVVGTFPEVQKSGQYYTFINNNCRN